MTSDAKVLLKLCDAIRNKDTRMVRSVLLKHPGAAKPAASDMPEGMLTPLWQALLGGGHEKIIERLIDFGADVNERYLFKGKNLNVKFYNLTFLQCLALQDEFWRNSESIAKILIRRGADVNADYNIHRARSALELALRQGNLECAEFLLQNGAKFSNTMGHVFIAPIPQQVEVLQMLIKFRLIANFKVRYDYLLYYTIGTAVNQRSPNISVLKIAKTLLDYGTSVNRLDRSGKSPLYLAVCLGNQELISLLISKGADVNIKTNRGLFPLYVAAKNGNVNITDLLLKNGADVHEKSGETGQTALHVACLHRCDEVINLLIQKGAKISAEDLKGRTPFSYLRPHLLKDTACINLIITEIAKNNFIYNQASMKDVDFIKESPVLFVIFKMCLKELSLMASIKFYLHYSYFDVLKMSKKIVKLAKLTKNRVLVTSFEMNQCKLFHYKNDLRRIWKEAIQKRDEIEAVESRIVPIFNKAFPDVVIRKLTENLTLEDCRKLE